VDAGRHFTITKGEEHVKKFKKSETTPSGITRCFCDLCGTRIMNEFNPDLPFWPEGTTKPIVFFPNTLEEKVAMNLPEVFRAKFHNESKECVLDFGLVRQLESQGTDGEEEKPAWK
jgi:hypothetical protein